MSTHCTIAIENEDGTIRSIYCNWDGHLHSAGSTLNEHYQDRKKVEKLIDLGAISTLHPKTEPSGPHTFWNPEPGVCIAYDRDRKLHPFNRVAKVRDRDQLRTISEDRVYLFSKEGEWLFATDRCRDWRPLSQALLEVARFEKV